MSIIINVCFSRLVRRAHRKTITEFKYVTGMKLYGFTDIQDGPAVRQSIMDHPRRPKGIGWGIDGYALIDSAPDPKRISYE